MNKISEQKYCILSCLLTILIIGCISSVPTASAQQLTQQQGLNILKNVVGLDLSNYSISIKGNPSDLQSSYLGVAPQDTFSYNLSSTNSKLNALCTFTSGQLQMIYIITDDSGTAKTGENVNGIDVASDFLNNYETYTGNSLFSELKASLSTVGSIEGNTTLISGNKVLEVNSSKSNTSLKWYYTANGAIAPYSKYISIGIREGKLAYFVDNWNLNNIGSDTVRISKEEAVQTALLTAKTHNWSVPISLDSVSINLNEKDSISWSSLTFDNSIAINNARSSNLLQLYPVWRVGVVLDKWYGNLYGIEVDVWADTGQVRSIREEYSTLPPIEDKPATTFAGNSLMYSLIPSLFAAGIITFSFVIARTLGYSLVQKKAGAIILCLLISSTLAFGALATASATSRGVYVWGARSTGAVNDLNDPDSWSWRKTSGEINLQVETTMYIAYYFANNGYTAYNHEASVRSQITSDLSNMYTKDYWAVVDFDHGIFGYPDAAPSEAHYMFEDDYGTKTGRYDNPVTNWSNAIYDMDIRQFALSRVPFAFINTCLSANTTVLGQGTGVYGSGNPVGMPYAWTGKLVTASPTSDPPAGYMSSDGYNYPDAGSNVYIGFPYGSAALEQNVPYNYGHSYNSWVIVFFYNALYSGVSVNQALDIASVQTWGTDFGSSPLREGFTANWPLKDGNGQWQNNYGYGSTMAVYGNGNIFLAGYEQDFVSTPSVTPFSYTTQTNEYVDFTANSMDPSMHTIQYVFDWGDSSQTYTDFVASGTTMEESHYWTSEGTYTVTVYAHCSNGAWSSPSYHTVHVSQPTAWLTIEAYDTYPGSSLSPNILVDGNSVGNAPLSIEIPTGYHTITFEDPTSDPTWGMWAYLVGFDGSFSGYSSYNSVYIDLYSDSTIIAYYSVF